MDTQVLQLDPKDNVLIALRDLAAGETVHYAGQQYVLPSAVPAKHKFVMQERAAGDAVFMYGVIVGRAREPIPRGGVLTTRNLRHDANSYSNVRSNDAWSQTWKGPDVTPWRQRRFLGYRRPDGQVGTRNYWLVVPLVFCENRNVDVLRQAFEEELGYAQPQVYRHQVARLAELYRQGKVEEIQQAGAQIPDGAGAAHPVFPNVDGVRFLTHQAGCGGTREDANNLCGLLAGYIHNPNVAGATVLSLGCQNAQASTLVEELKRRDPAMHKPLLVFEHQKTGLESEMLTQAVRETFLGLVKANQCAREPAGLEHLTVGLKCGGSDGFSGISANPALGHMADMLAELKGKGILAEFPELCGMEQNLIDRCVSQQVADRFVELMRDYAARAKAVHSGFEMNPSPGNIQDGLITDAIKSAGAARKGGNSPVTDVLDYPEYATRAGLNLLCTPGNDVECVTAQVAAGANLVCFTTGLGTPTGNPIAPVIKIATNNALARKMHDIIDWNAGSIVTGEHTIEQMGEKLLEFVIEVASGRVKTKAELLAQYDFIPWKRGVSL